MQELWRDIRKPFLPYFFILLGIFFFSKLFGPIPFSVNSVQTTKDSFFNVDGVGEATAIPNTAKISLGVTSTAAAVDVAQEATNTKTNKIVSELKKLGIEEKNIKTTNYSVNPNYDFRPTGESQQIKDYTVTQNIDVEVKPIERANQAIDTATKNGANMVGGVQFVLDEETLETLKRQARNDAIKKAKQKAQDLANAAGIRLGRIVNITESSPGPYYYDSRGVANTAVEKQAEFSEPTELTPGENKIQISIYLSYETL